MPALVGERLDLAKQRVRRVGFIAGLRGELVHVVTAIAVLGWLLPTPQRLDRGVEGVHVDVGDPHARRA